MKELKPTETEKHTIESVICRVNGGGIIGLNDNDLAFLASQHGTQATVNMVPVPLADIVVAARSEMWRRQKVSEIHAMEALVRMTEAQDKSARRLTYATFGLVVATTGLIVATIFH